MLEKNLVGNMFYDYLGNVEDKIFIDSEGNGNFKCNAGSVSVWIKDSKYVN